MAPHQPAEGSEKPGEINLDKLPNPQIPLHSGWSDKSAPFSALLASVRVYGIFVDGCIYYLPAVHSGVLRSSPHPHGSLWTLSFCEGAKPLLSDYLDGFCDDKMAALPRQLSGCLLW